MIDLLKPFFLSSKQIEIESSAQKAYTIDVLRKTFILLIGWFVFILYADQYIYSRYSEDFVELIWNKMVLKISILGILIGYILDVGTDRLYFKACVKPFKSKKQKQRMLSKYSFVIPTVLKSCEGLLWAGIVTSLILPIVHPWMLLLYVAFTMTIVCFIGAIIFTYYKENRKKLYTTGGLAFGGLAVFLSLFNIYFKYWWIGTGSILGSIMMLAYAIARCRDRVAEIKKAHPNLTQEELSILIRRYKVADIMAIFDWLVTIVLTILSFGGDD